MMRNRVSAAIQHLRVLTCDIGERCIGSQGNLEATRYIRDELMLYGWDVESQRFEAFDWLDEGAAVRVENTAFGVTSSPYSLACDVEAQLVCASTINQLSQINAKDRLLLISGDLTREPLMPKGFPFYNPEHHKQVVAALEQSGANAIICLVNERATHDGGEYPFAVIEDGDFQLPSVYMTEQEGVHLRRFEGMPAHLVISTRRRPSCGYNVVGRQGPARPGSILVTAHVDAKKGSPGAIDNATGVATILLLAEMMAGYKGKVPVELAVLNGEDYYSVPGQVTYLQQNEKQIARKRLNINIDGVGLNQGSTAFSFFDLPGDIEAAAADIISQQDGIVQGAPWVQGDHSMFLQYGVPAIAVSSQWLIENLVKQNITHTSRDTMEIVDAHRIVKLAAALEQLISMIR